MRDDVSAKVQTAKGLSQALLILFLAFLNRLILIFTTPLTPAAEPANRASAEHATNPARPQQPPRDPATLPRNRAQPIGYAQLPIAQADRTPAPRQPNARNPAPASAEVRAAGRAAPPIQPTLAGARPARNRTQAIEALPATRSHAKIVTISQQKAVRPASGADPRPEYPVVKHPPSLYSIDNKPINNRGNHAPGRHPP